MCKNFMKFVSFSYAIFCVSSEAMSGGGVAYQPQAPSSEQVRVFHSSMIRQFLNDSDDDLEITSETQESTFRDELEDFIMRNKGCINTKNESGDTVLHTVIRRGNAKRSIKLLLKHGALIDAPNNRRLTPLNLAVEINNVTDAEILLAAGANVNAQDENGNTPLHYAVGNLNDNMVQILIDKKANLEVANSSGNTPLLVLLEGFSDTFSTDDSSSTQENMVRQLHKAGALIDATNFQGETLLHKAARRRNTRITLLLVRKCPSLIGSMNYFFQTILHYACQPRNGEEILSIRESQRQSDEEELSGDEAQKVKAQAIREIVELFIKACEPSCYASDQFGNCPIHYWCSFIGSDLGTFKAASNKVIWMKNSAGWTPLHLACFYNNIPLVEDLVAEANDDQLNAMIPASGKDALMLACELGHSEVCDILLTHKRRIIINRVEIVGTALDWACEFGRIEVCRKLLKIEGFHKQTEKHKVLLLRRALQLGNDDLATLFLDAWSWTTIDDEGDSALHIACYGGYVEVVRKLLRKIGVFDMAKEHRNKKGKTVIDIARVKADPEILKTLRIDPF